MGSGNQLHLVTHPLVQQKLAAARNSQASPDDFRRLVREIAMLMAFEITREYPTKPVEVMTPMGKAMGAVLQSEITLVPVLRAGLGMADGVSQLIPQARIGHIGIYRDENSLEPILYYNKLPPNIHETEVIVIDPMLATGGSCSVAIAAVKERKPLRIKLLCLVAAPEGIHRIRDDHPDVAIYTAAVDSRLNDQGYIVPGLGDAGDRIFGTE